MKRRTQNTLDAELYLSRLSIAIRDLENYIKGIVINDVSTFNLTVNNVNCILTHYKDEGIVNKEQADSLESQINANDPESIMLAMLLIQEYSKQCVYDHKDRLQLRKDLIHLNRLSNGDE